MTNTLVESLSASFWSEDREVERTWLIALFVLALLMRLSAATGLIGSDDIGYANFARTIADGTYTPTLHHYSVRYGLIVPVGAIFAIFGLSEWSTIALPLVASSVSVVLIAVIGARLFGRSVGLLAAIFYASFPLQLHYASILVPESVAECYVLFAILVHIKTDTTKPFVRGVLGGMLIGIAYLCKEPALFIAPPLFFDAVLNKRWRHAAGLTAGAILVMALESLYYTITKGDPAFRQHALAFHNAGMISNPKEIISDLSYRLWKVYPRMMLVPNEHFGLHSLLAILLAGIAIIFGIVRDTRARFLALWIAIPWLYVNFGSSSFSQYIALPVAPRYIEFAYPPLFLGAAWCIANAARNSSALRRAVPALMTFVVVSGMVVALHTKGTGYDSPSVAVLRVISRDTNLRAGTCVHLAGSPAQIRSWTDVLRVLNGRDVTKCGNGTAAITIGSDSLLLPHVTQQNVLEPGFFR